MAIATMGQFCEVLCGSGLRRKLGSLEYEGNHVICFKCEMYDHRQEDCSKGKNPSAHAAYSSEKGAEEDSRLPESAITETYGKWILAKKPIREKGKSDVIGKGSMTGKNQPKTVTNIASVSNKESGKQNGDENGNA